MKTTHRQLSPVNPSSGFTLVEIMVVIMIIALLTGLVGKNVIGNFTKGKRTAAKAQIQVLSSALTTYRMDNGRYPTQTQGLKALVIKPNTEPVPKSYLEGGYLDKTNLPLDSWGVDYIYVIPGRQNEKFEIISYGSDGEPGGTGGDADLSSSDAQ